MSYAPLARNTLAVGRYLPSGLSDPDFRSGYGLILDLPTYTPLGVGVALALDGESIVIGTGTSAHYSEMHRNFFVAVRLDAAGELVPAFGGRQGFVQHPAFPRTRLLTCCGVEVDSKGRIVLAYRALRDLPGFTRTGYVVRLNSDGTLDDHFGETGIVCIKGVALMAMTLGCDDSVFAVGTRDTKPLSAGFVRISPNAATVSVTEITPPGVFSSGACITRAPAGELIAGVSGGGGFTMARFSPDGAIDASFGIDGVVTTLFNTGKTGIRHIGVSGGSIRALGLLGYDEVIEPGVSQFVATHVAMAQFDSAGHLDPEFSGDGKFATPIPPAWQGGFFQGVADTRDRGLVVCGTIGTGLSLVRLSPNGTPDVTFSPTGARQYRNFRTVAGDKPGEHQRIDGEAVVEDDHGRFVACGSIPGARAEEDELAR